MEEYNQNDVEKKAKECIRKKDYHTLRDLVLYELSWTESAFRINEKSIEEKIQEYERKYDY